MRPRSFIDGDIDLRKIHGDFDLGVNATGVISTSIHFTGDEIITREVMPAEYVQRCFDEVHALGEQMRGRRQGGKIKGRIPLPIYVMWRREWEKTGKQYGLLWRAFLSSKLMDGDWKKFRVDGV